jgi:hypothetical protein
VSNDNQVRVAVPLVAKIGVALLGLVLLAVLGVLIAVLSSLEATRSELRTTRMGVVAVDQRVERVTGQLDPLLAATEPLTQRPARKRLRRAGSQVSTALDNLPELTIRAREGVDAAVYLAQDVQDADLGGTLRAVRALADAGLAGDRLTRLLDAGQTVLAGLDAAALRRIVGRVDHGVADLDRVPPRSIAACDTRLRSNAPTADGQVACLLRTVPNLRALLRAQLRANRKSVGTQESQLSVNRRQYDLFKESISIQRELLVHLRSLDRKTGGTAPSTPVSP